MAWYSPHRLVVSFNFPIVFGGAIAVIAAVAACSGGNTTPPSQKSHARKPDYVVTAQSGVLLGGLINPSDSPSPAQQEGETEYLEDNQIYRKLALHHEYRKWQDLLGAATDSEFLGDKDWGRIPVIAMECGDDIGRSEDKKLNLMQIIDHQADGDLTTISNDLLQLNYPVMIRYFWEFNVNAGGGKGADANGNGGCFVQPGTPMPPGSYPDTVAPDYATQFVQAWQQVRTMLLGFGSPQPNITFIWNPYVNEDPDPNEAPVDYTTFYPGPQYVDWIAFDGYSKVGSNSLPMTFDQIFGTDIANVSNDTSVYGNKPIMIGETGACAEYAHDYGPPYDQASYLASIESELDPPSVYPTVHAFMYFDGVAEYVPPEGTCNWSFSSSGLAQFKTMGQDPNFTGMVTQNNP